MKKRYMVVSMNKDLPQDNNIDVMYIEAYGIRSAVTIAVERLTNRYPIEPYKWEIVNVLKTL